MNIVMFRNVILGVCFTFIFVHIAFAQRVIDVVKEPVFKEDEELCYDVKYGFIKGGEAILKILPETKIENNNVFHLLAIGKTVGMFNYLYKVSDRYDSYIDRKTFLPYLYTEDIREGKYRRKDKAKFFQKERKIEAAKGVFKGSEQTLDIVSAYYFLRSLDIDEFKENERIIIRYFLDDEIAPVEVRYLGKENIKTPLGTFRCLKFTPSVRPGKVFKKNSAVYLWVTDDKNRIPVKIEMEIFMGALKVELVSAKGLKYPTVSQTQ